MESLFIIRNNVIIQKYQGLSQDIKIRNAIKATGYTNIHEILAPATRTVTAEDDPLQIPTREVERAVRLADIEVYRELYGIDKSYVWYSKEVFDPFLKCQIIKVKGMGRKFPHF